MSPRTEIESVRDVDMEREQERETEGMEIAQDGTDESHKRTDIDDDMLAMANVPSRGGIGGGGAMVAGNREVARASAGDALSRRQQTAGRFPQVIGEIHEVDVWGPVGKGPRWVEDSGLVGLGNEYSHMRIIPTPPSSYLRPGSRFEGQQQSERQRYDVEVEIKHVDLRESFLCGYLRIQGRLHLTPRIGVSSSARLAMLTASLSLPGLTDDHPTLTTYFEGEIIGSKYGFITQHPSWGATEKIDLSHWAKFTAFRPFSKQTRKGGQIFIGDVAQRENIFMRWKEHFLVPDHRVRTINGASFEGFYYICFNQVRGEVSGIYFHSKSEK